MANKIPVGATVARTYDFAFRNFLPNLGAIWMPFLLLAVAGLFLSKAQLPFWVAFASQSAAFDPSSPASDAAMQNLISEMTKLGPYLSLSMLIVYASLSSMFVGLTKEALELRKGNAFLQMPFATPVWMLIGAYLLLMLILVGIYIGFFILILILVGISSLASHLSSALSILLTIGLVLAGIAGWCAMIVAAFRLSFLLVPLVVAEESISFRRGRQLTRGNFWRIFIVWLAVFVPMMFASVAYMIFLFGGDLLPPLNALDNPEAIAAWPQHFALVFQHLVEQRLNWWFVYLPIELIFSAIFYGLWAGVSAFSYQALAAGEPA